jgi:glutathione peroxidase
MMHATAAALGGLRLASSASSSFVSLLTFSGINGAAPVVPAPRSVVLLVNTASHCGYTKQLKGLQALHVKYGGRGLAVIGVPSNDFGAQEPDDEAKILAFYASTYGVTFPLTAKTAVLGAARHPAYARLEAQLGDAGVPDWNFAKFLVGRSGELAGLFAAGMEPGDPAVVAAIEAELSEPI